MKRLLQTLAMLSSLMVSGSTSGAATPLTVEEQSVKDSLRSLLRQQDDAVLRRDRRGLRTIYVQVGAGDALRHARARMHFLQAWQAARGVKIEGASVDLRTPAIRFLGKDRVRVTAFVSENFRYRSARGPALQQAFGLGTRRFYVLRKERFWRIQAEDYTDPLDQDTRIPGEAMPAAPASRELAHRGQSVLPSLSALRAVRYADNYCGGAPGCGNDRRYNPRYNDFNGEGGDCTNFVSQTLRDAGFRQTGEWAWDARKGDGTRAWSNAEGLVAYLLDSGRAQRIGGGTYEDVTTPGQDGSPTPIARLVPGDIIGYREQGRIVHLALVVGLSPTDYVLVDSHTADRYHVPWDIGWDRRTRYVLLKLRYPEGGAPALSRPGGTTPARQEGSSGRDSSAR